MMILFITVILSCGYMIWQAHHDCTGEQCPICIEIEHAMQVLFNLKVMPHVTIYLITLCILMKFYVTIKESKYIKHTLISLKVELLD